MASETLPCMVIQPQQNLTNWFRQEFWQAAHKRDELRRGQSRCFLLRVHTEHNKVTADIQNISEDTSVELRLAVQSSSYGSF